VQQSKCREGKKQEKKKVRVVDFTLTLVVSKRPQTEIFLKRIEFFKKQKIDFRECVHKISQTVLKRSVKIVLQCEKKAKNKLLLLLS
jgi:hypothetical protein